MATLESVGVVGAGTMGSGIAQACAVSGLNVVLVDVSEAALQRGLKTMSTSLDRLIKKEKITEQDKAIALARVRGAIAIPDLAGVDVVIEAATENLELKLKLLKDVAATVRPDVPVASNTSSISITRLAAAIDGPQRFIGMHFFNPVPMMALVEIIRGLQTDDATHARVVELATRLGKTPITVRNSPGFVVNRLLCPMINEAIFTLQEGLASAEEIDEAMKLGAGHPIGPLALADMIGLDVMLAVMNVFWDNFNDPKYRPAPLLRDMVDAGYLGRKTGRGFYTYG